VLFWYNRGWQVQSSFFGNCDGLCCFGATEYGVLVAAFFVESSDCVVSVQRCLCVKIIKKVVSRSNCFSGNFIRWKFFEDPTFVDSNFFPGPVPVSRLTHHPDSSTETTLCSSCLSIDTLWYQRATYYYRGPIEQSVRFSL
jgi:hypothetical protein